MADRAVVGGASAVTGVRVWDGGEDGADDGRAAVEVQLEDVFAGGGAGGGEVEDQGAGVEDGWGGVVIVAF